MPGIGEQQSTRSHKIRLNRNKKKAADVRGSNLGRAIIRQQFPAAASAAAAEEALETERGKHKLRSVTQCDDLEELMSRAVLAGTDFTSRHGEIVVVGSEAKSEVERTRAPEGFSVPIPRRPAWTAGQAAAELERNEKASFLEWRRGMADLEEEQGYLLTPFEKNLEVWRQLWRVLERAQLVVQIVDARNPLLFRCADLEAYVSELGGGKRCLLLVNKADLLTDAQRGAWAEYLGSKRIEFVFWSAAAAQADLEEAARREKLGLPSQGARADTAAEGGEEDEEEEEEGGGEVEERWGVRI